MIQATRVNQMNQEEIIIAKILRQPDDDTIWRLYADWLEEQSDDRGQLLRAWFDLREASYGFSLAASVNGSDADFKEFEGPVRRYTKLTANVENWDWLFRLAKNREWINLHLATQICRLHLWRIQEDWLAIEDSFDLEDRAFLFCYKSRKNFTRAKAGPDVPMRCFCLVHRYLGFCETTGTYSPNSVLWAMERNRFAPEWIITLEKLRAKSKSGSDH